MAGTRQGPSSESALPSSPWLDIVTQRGTVPVRSANSDQLEKFLTIEDARAIGADRVKIENYPHIIWWVMDKGYVVCPQGIRPKWFFASEEETISPPGD